MNTPSADVSPGLGGFLAFFLLALALWLLMRNMNTRLRRLSYREEQEAREREARERAVTDPAAGPGEDPGTGPGDDAGTDRRTDRGTDPGTDPGTDRGTDPGTGRPGPAPPAAAG